MTIPRLLGFLDRLEEGFLAVALAFMTLITFVQVVLRYVFGSGLVWSLEATTYTFSWLVLIGMSYGVRTRSHIAVDVLNRRLPPVPRRAVATAALALSLIYCAMLVYGGVILVDRLYTLGNYARDIPAPRWLLNSILPLAFGLLAFRLLQAGRSLFMGRDDKFEAGG